MSSDSVPKKEPKTFQHTSRTLQMTPSQSKIKTSVLSRSCEAGSDSLRTLAFMAVLKEREARGTKALGAKAEADEANNEIKASCDNFIID